MRANRTRTTVLLRGLAFGAALLLAAGAAASAAASAADPADAAPPVAQPLVVRSELVEVNGRRALVFSARTEAGKPLMRGRRGERLRIELVNLTGLPITMHPHGVLLPNSQDGVPYVTQLPVPPGGRFVYDFTPTQSGTYFFHSHFGWELQDQLAIPLILDEPATDENADPARDAASNAAEPKEVVMMLTDFIFESPPGVFEVLCAPKGAPSAAPSGADGMPGMGSMGAAGDAGKPDLTDVAYDAVLANGRTMDSMQVVRVAPGSTVRLRLINASCASNFRVDLGSLRGRAIEVDGEPIEPVELGAVDLAIAQRVDLLVELPADFVAQVIRAQAEGTTLATGVHLVAHRIQVPKFDATVSAPIGAVGVGYEQERRFRAATPLPKRPIDRSHMITLDGTMNGYRWNLNGMRWPEGPRLAVKEGERVELVFENKTMMSHPMHLHGHTFQVTEIDGQPLDGAVRDTILVMPKSTVKVQFDANAPGLWMMHCHITWHEAAGMLGIVEYEGCPKPEWYLEKDTFREPSSLPR